MESTLCMCKELRCVSQFMPQPQKTTWRPFRAQQSVNVEAAAGIRACDDLWMLSQLVTKHLPPLVPMVEYVMYCHPSYYQAASRKIFSEPAHSKSQAILLMEVQEEWSTILITITRWGVLAPHKIVKLKKKKKEKSHQNLSISSFMWIL